MRLLIKRAKRIRKINIIAGKIGANGAKGLKITLSPLSESMLSISMAEAENALS